MPAAQRLRSWSRGVRHVELWLTADIVAQPPGTFCDALLNPANASLVGTALPYFPRGGPVPNLFDRRHTTWMPPGFVSQWGGMEVGEGQLYSQQVVDGRVHRLGGAELRAQLAQFPVLSPRGAPELRCPEGSAVVTPAVAGLREHFRHIVHVVAPFYSNVDWEGLLGACYAAGLQAAGECGATAAASPLLGAGAKGAPAGPAARVAAAALHTWALQGGAGAGAWGPLECVQLAAVDARHADALQEALEASFAPEPTPPARVDSAV